MPTTGKQPPEQALRRGNANDWRAIRSCSLRAVSSGWGLTFNRTSSLRCCTSADGMVGVTTIETTAACAPTLLVSVPRRGAQTGDETPMGPQKTRAESRRLCPRRPDSNRYDALKTHCAHMKSDEKRTLLADSYKTRLSLSNDDLKLLTLSVRFSGSAEQPQTHVSTACTARRIWSTPCVPAQGKNEKLDREKNR